MVQRDTSDEESPQPDRPLVLRSLEQQDAETLAGWALDGTFCAEAGWTPDLSLSEYRQWHRQVIAEPPAELLRLAVLEGSNLVGYVDLSGESPDRRELGFVIGGRTRWGSGLGRRAAAAGVRYGFERLGLTSIWAEALDANQRSIRILRRLGMTETGRGEPDTFLGQPTFYRRFQLTVEEWQDDHHGDRAFRPR